MRNLAILQSASPETRYATFIKNTADSVWKNDRIGQAQFGTIWKGPAQATDASTQISAVQALAAAVRVKKNGQ